MSSDQTQNFKGIVSCIPSFGDASCLTYCLFYSVRPFSLVSVVYFLSLRLSFFISIYDSLDSKIKYMSI